MASRRFDLSADTGLMTPEEHLPTSARADSPIESMDPAAYSQKTPQLNQSGPVAGKMPSPPGSISKGAKEKSSAFRFVVVDHPDQLRNRQEMRENRMHVMHDYLDKERRRPGSQDSRVTGSGGAKRRKKQLAVPVRAGDETGSSKSSRLDYSRLTPAESLESDGSSDREPSDRSDVSAVPASRSMNGATSGTHPLIRQSKASAHEERPLVSGIGGRFEHSAYHKALPNEIPVGPGSKLEPFGTWPAFIDPSLDVNALKFSCSQRFGSAHLGMHWIPTLLRARHAFLSTLCISSAHDAVMSRALIPLHAQTATKSIQRWKVKRDVISMVTETMNDPTMQTADETIIAVLHLLNSDIMGCDDRDMKIHQDGLNNMVLQRGGLANLGLEGQLAGILTITMFLIGALRELPPHQDYVHFASTKKHKIPSDSQLLPESPVYCRSSGFHSVKRIAFLGSVTYELLETTRSLTSEYVFELEYRLGGKNNTPDPSCWHRKSKEVFSSLHRKILAFQPAKDMDFNDMNERYTYESIRLASLVYAHALANKIPFSKAAAELSGGTTPKSSPGARSANFGMEDTTTPLPIQIKHALMRTDTSLCWDHMGGVLFWIALVGGAAANPGPLADHERIGEDEDARKFIAAIAVRCCIVLSFQFGGAILETLKRVVMIESTLADHDLETHPSVSGDVLAGPSSKRGTKGSFGPVEPPETQRGFADFAQDFLSI